MSAQISTLFKIQSSNPKSQTKFQKSKNKSKKKQISPSHLRASRFQLRSIKMFGVFVPVFYEQVAKQHAAQVGKVCHIASRLGEPEVQFD